MALYVDKCKHLELVNVDLAVGHGLTEEGLALVIDTSDADLVKVSTGAAGEHFVGVAYLDSVNIETHALAEDLTIGASEQVGLRKSDLVADQIVVSIAGVALNEVLVAPANATEFLVDDATGIVTFHSSNVGNTATIKYRYNLTVIEAKQLFQQSLSSVFAVTGSNKASAMQGLGMKIYSTCYDLSNGDFSVGDDVHLGADGLFTTDPTGTKVGVVIEVPAVDDSVLGAYMGMMMNAPVIA